MPFATFMHILLHLVRLLFSYANHLHIQQPSPTKAQSSKWHPHKDWRGRKDFQSLKTGLPKDWRQKNQTQSLKNHSHKDWRQKTKGFKHF